MMCWVCQMLEAQAAVVARCHDILQQQMEWCSLISRAKDMHALFTALLHPVMQPPVPDASIIVYGMWS